MEKKEKRTPVTIDYPFKITMLEEPAYTKNVSLRRFYSHYIWGKNLNLYLKTIEKPDVVYCAVPSLTGPSYAARYCHDNNIRFVIDIQDLWPEAFKLIIKQQFLSDFLFKPFEKTANKIYGAADAVCAVSDFYIKRAVSVNKKCKTGVSVFLGTELETFDNYARQTPCIKKNQGEIWLAYCGSLGASYDLPCVFEALHSIKDKITIKFIVMGDGQKREEFEKYAKRLEVDAVFLGRLPYDQMCSVLCECDITVNPIMHGSAASIINKHGDYAASGLPVINTQDCEEYRNLVDSYEMGFNCKNGDSNDMAKVLLMLANDEELRIKMGKNARKCAEEKFDRKTSYLRLIDSIVG